MDVIERWECPEHGGDHVARWADGRRTCWICEAETVTVEYVTRSELTGAVAGAERYLTDALKMFDAGSPTSARAYVDSALSDLRRVRAVAVS